MTKEEVKDYIFKTYSVEGDCPFEEDFTDVVFRHKENRKWFALLMYTEERRLKGSSNELIDVINVKCEPCMIGGFLDGVSVFPAYHMNKNHWISLYLKNIDENLFKILIDVSFNLTLKGKASKRSKR